MKIKKIYNLNEDFDDSFDSLDSLLIDEPTLTVPTTEMPEPTESQEDIGVTQVLSDLIKNTWDAIDKYKSAISTLKSLGGHEDLVNVLENASSEEMVNIGQLEGCMKKTSPDVEKIEDGKEEASEQIDSEVKTESLHREKSLKESLNEDELVTKYHVQTAYWMQRVEDELYNIIERDVETSDDECYFDEIERILENKEALDTLCKIVADDFISSDPYWSAISDAECFFDDSILKHIRGVIDMYDLHTPSNLEDMVVESNTSSKETHQVKLNEDAKSDGFIYADKYDTNTAYWMQVVADDIDSLYPDEDNKQISKIKYLQKNPELMEKFCFDVAEKVRDDGRVRGAINNATDYYILSFCDKYHDEMEANYENNHFIDNSEEMTVESKSPCAPKHRLNEEVNDCEYWEDVARNEIEYLREDCDDDDLLKQLTDEGVEELVNVVSGVLMNNDYLWETVTDTIRDCISDNIEDVLTRTTHYEDMVVENKENK